MKTIDYSKIEIGDIETKPISITIDYDLKKALKKISKRKDIPLSYVFDYMIRSGIVEAIEKKKGVEEMRKYKKEKLNTTLKADLNKIVRDMQKLKYSPFSYILNHLLRVAFQEALKLEKKKQ